MLSSSTVASTSGCTLRSTGPAARCKLVSPSLSHKALSAPSLQTNRRGLRTRSLRQATVCVLDVTEDTFEKEVLKSEVPVLVDFWAQWCGPCKLVAPLLSKLEKEYGDALKIVKIDTDPNKNLVEQYKVYGLPTFKVFRNGKEVEGSHSEGAMNKDKLVAYLEKHGVALAAK